MVYLAQVPRFYPEGGVSARPGWAGRFGALLPPLPTCRRTAWSPWTLLRVRRREGAGTQLVTPLAHAFHDLRHFAALPNRGDERALHRVRVHQRHGLHLAGSVGDVLRLVVVARKRGLVVLDVLDDGDLARGQTDLLAFLFVVDRPANGESRRNTSYRSFLSWV